MRQHILNTRQYLASAANDEGKGHAESDHESAQAGRASGK
jgi:hypothetical protein